MKIKWKVDEPPTGRYRSFSRRAWPTAHFDNKDKSSAAQILCDDEYVPSRVKIGDHKELKIKIVIPYPKEQWPEKGAFEWKTLKARAKTLDEAKQLVQKFYDAHPEYVPKED